MSINKSSVVNLNKGKIPPQATDLEESVIGSLLAYSESIYDVAEILFPDAFYLDKHRLIYKAITDLFTDGSGVDLLTVSQLLRKQGNLEKVGGDFYLIGLTQKSTSSAHIIFHSRIILQKHIQRSIIRISSGLTEDAYDEETDVFDLLDGAYNSLNSVTEQTIKQEEVDFATLVDAQIERGEKIFRGEILPGLTTPIKRLTNKMGGWRDSELIIFAARPSMGKTAFALKCAIHTAAQGIPVLIFSLEMNKGKLTDRIISMEARINGNKFTMHGLSKNDIEAIEPIKGRISKMPIHIDDTASLSDATFQVKAKIAHRKHKIGLIIVDYLQLMHSSSKNREQEISSISRSLKKTAMDLDVPVIAISQLSRAVETRGGSKRPILSDLRESGAIEQDADVVQFFYRPEYYGIDSWDDEEYAHAPTENECEYIVAKNRNGALVRNRMKFIKEFTLFEDMETQVDFDFDRKKKNPEDNWVFNKSRSPLPDDNDDNEVPF